LTGKRVVVTRAREQAAELTSEIERLGAEVILFPTVKFAAPSDWQPLDSALRAISKFDWILLTSQNAAGFFAKRCGELGIDVKTLQSPRPFVGAVGPATAQAATEAGLRVDYTATKNSGEALAQELWGSIGDRTVLWPRSDRGDDRLLIALREAGANVTEVIAYRTAAPETFDPAIVEKLRRAEVDAIIFASPSAYHNLSDVIETEELVVLSSRVDFAVIGPTTARAVRGTGARVAIEANESSAAGLADSIAKYYQRQVSEAESSSATGKLADSQ
jgi:uroporphyrinogen III methyltransferase/synthase